MLKAVSLTAAVASTVASTIACSALYTPPDVVSQGPAQCSEALQPHRLTPISELTADQDLVLYPESCNGVLYLLNSRDYSVATPVNDGWWLEEVLSARQNPATGDIHISATFITGIGPSGVIPFPADYIVKRTGGQWQSHYQEFDGPFVDRYGKVEIYNDADLHKLKLRNAAGQPYRPDVDFSTQRLVLNSVWLTSGSSQITGVQGWRNDRGYFLTYTTRTPAMATTDMKHAVIYVILPRDPRLVSFEDPELDAKKFEPRYGILDRGQFEGAPAP